MDTTIEPAEPSLSEDSQKPKLCGRRKNCSKPWNHASKCDKKRVLKSLQFTAKNVTSVFKKIKDKVSNLTQSVQNKGEELLELDELISMKDEQKVTLEADVEVLCKECDKYRTILNQTEQGRSRRSGAPTDEKMITNNASSTRYRRRKETGAMLQYYHGGEEGAKYGAWDFFQSHSSPEMMERLFLNHKRGKFLQKIYGKFKEGDKSALDRAIALKYSTFQSRRKYIFQCKIQKCMYDVESETFGKNYLSYGDYNLDINIKPISHSSVDKFIKNLDVGELHQIEGYSGVTRTVTALITMIVDLNLKVKSLKGKLIWFNNNINHFVVEFSDDGAPESAERTMTIGTLSLFNYGNRIRSRDFHYLLHMLSASEKDQMCELLWQQHCQEMELIEGNVLKINNETCTFEFLPSADTSWLCFAANVLGCSATYPSPFANLHKGDLSEMRGSIGIEKHNRWKIPTADSREKELKLLNDFRSKNNHPNQQDKHKKELEFMAENGIRQLGPARIGSYANKLCPEPLHLEVNSWTHILDVIYKEAVRRNKFESFIKALGNQQRSNEENTEPGCGLAFIAREVKKHHADEAKRMKHLDIRLIGSQAISLVQYSFRLVDSLSFDGETPRQHVQRLALGKICESLRDIGSLINRIDVDGESYPETVNALCTTYFNLFSLFFKQHCQLTVWTMGYVIPYHAKLIYERYKVSFGIMSLQGKESKHSSIKQELRNNSNCSNALDETGKWHQIARSNYVRKFYLPFHFPVSNTYHSHYRPRKAVPRDDEVTCPCSRPISGSERLCNDCIESADIMQCAQEARLIDDVLAKVMPISCFQCTERFAYKLQLDIHTQTNHLVTAISHIQPERKTVLIPRNMNKDELKEALRERNMDTRGTKSVLQKRLEGRLTTEM